LVPPFSKVFWRNLSQRYFGATFLKGILAQPFSKVFWRNLSQRLFGSTFSKGGWN